jgi:hypothetical protein
LDDWSAFRNGWFSGACFRQWLVVTVHFDRLVDWPNRNGTSALDSMIELITLKLPLSAIGGFSASVIQ